MQNDFQILKDMWHLKINFLTKIVFHDRPSIRQSNTLINKPKYKYFPNNIISLL